ncbi:protein O-glucosyltransferase 2-like [Bombyx mandarina]|uniref:Protein O-glucosyltransferase 2-like n=1 Tax=Bombyx mandarina TaxID=7092 RepID=A0A6J2JXP0_BOMMA|nr:protein O-glucosyltransferase 2-like [Bombyx mandarina]
MKSNMYSLFIFFLKWHFIQCSQNNGAGIYLSGPGLKPDKIVLPARYFFITFSSVDEETYTSDWARNVAVEIKGKTQKTNYCRIWVNKLDRKDGTFIVRYKIYETCFNLSINIYYKSKNIEGSPVTFKGPILPDQCNCPTKDLTSWLTDYGCNNVPEQIVNDLKAFQAVNMTVEVKRIVEKYHQPESTSFCHYIIKGNEIFRNCYGRHVGFNMFADNILLSLTRKVKLPDVEMVINLGDWPLIIKNTELLPVFSWCGSSQTIDILMPTYDITESTLENMGRVTLDMLSVQGNVERPWSQREPRAIWRGRDSRLERLKLVDIARSHPDLFNVSLTNFFFFREKEEQYGPKQPHISFFKFFDYKYLINVDGTVAAYRFPYLLAGGGLVLKQDSEYYEHFYQQLREWEHYVPVKNDLGDLVEKVQWALSNDDKAHQIARNARQFANDHLLPQNIICYHAALISEWSKRISNKIQVQKGMTHVPQLEFACDCSNTEEEIHDEL